MVHTREAEEDTERILKEIVPKDHRVHIHCFTDAAAFGLRLLDYFPTLHIGVTANLNTAELLKQMSANDNKRFLLETDAPYMVPANNLDYNVPGGKLNRGMSVVDTTEITKGTSLTDDEYLKAAVLGWGTKLLQALFLVSDDMMDSSITRRGQPC
ncbi:uncharacterized protein ARMOST_07640 [Armillaria ostoyae]|uniref:(2E,6E)-farnesyl diphosphate synthase n=1 Tax=Armillaria ostoyae TaxID=47428 RepID=A0A284R6H1_ARMOS|nr:uncharacterized protein ARMOST_07640 [Armillaria ostoyae]